MPPDDPTPARQKPARDPARLRVTQLNRRQDLTVDLQADAATRAGLVEEFGLIDLPALRLEGKLIPERGEGWRLDGRLVADVVQACVVSLQPVPAHLEEAVSRIWSPHVAPPEAGGEVEMGDDALEPLGQTIDLGAVMAEELSLALPPYPRAPGVALPEEEAPEEETRRPFAGLDKLLGDKAGKH